MRSLGLILLSVAMAGVSASQSPPAAAPPQNPQPAPAGPPSTDIYVAALAVSGTAWTVGKPENVTSSPGYDNQPFFTPDGAGLLFTSDRPQRGTRVLLKDAPPTPSTEPWFQQVSMPAQTDIFRYDFASREVARVTTTVESEYSPTVTPDGQGISVIRVERDQTQRLWRFTREGGRPTLVFEDIKPVGYHAWLDDRTVVMFVLGQPATLQVADTVTRPPQLVASDVGQSVQRIPSGGVSFVQQGAKGPMIMKVVLQEGKAVTTPLTAPVPGARQAHLAWTPDGTLLMAHSGWLHAWKPGDTAWRAVADLDALGLKGVTRLAVSPKGERIAIVAQ
jgi:hypothetical protein